MAPALFFARERAKNPAKEVKMSKRANNYGWKARKMDTAVRFAINERVNNRAMAFATAREINKHFKHFAKWAKEHRIGRLEYVTREAVIEYGRELAARVEAGELAASTAQNRISAINTGMHAASRGHWSSVSPTRECEIGKRTEVRTTPPPSIEAARSVVMELEREGNMRGAAIAGLCLELGMRSEEASLIDARSALSEARERGAIALGRGTKGGRPRVVPVTPEGVRALERAAEVQGKDRSLVPAHQTLAQWQETGLREIRETVAARLECRGLHDLRSTYACTRYQELTGRPAPVVAGGRLVDKPEDRAARQVIAEELGHGRPSVSASYIGSAA